MGTQTLYKYFFTGCFFLVVSITGLANGNKPHPLTPAFRNMAVVSAADTIPSPEKKNAEEKTESKTEDVIKEVPKSRKQAKPIAVTTALPVKPVVIKPKIVIKPIIKLH